MLVLFKQLYLHFSEALTSFMYSDSTAAKPDLLRLPESLTLSQLASLQS